MNGLALCSGIGGFDLGLKIAMGSTYRTVCHVERNAYAAAVLVAGMEKAILDKAPIWDDIESFDGAAWRGCIDIITAGFPCQAFSPASRGRRVSVDLWPAVLAVIEAVQPRYVFLENVIEAPWASCATDLVRSGYRIAGPMLACPTTLGADHHRGRCWLLADAYGQSESYSAMYAKMARIPATKDATWRAADLSRVLGIPDGHADRLDRLKVLGNAAVPIVAAHAFLSLMEVLHSG